MREMIDRWLRRAVHGDRLVYHIGCLHADRGFEVDGKLERTERQKMIDDGALRAWQLYEQKRVALVQKRLAYGVCSYIIVKL